MASRYNFQSVQTWRVLQGFDEYMNLVLDEAEEVSLKRKSRKPLGELLCCFCLHQADLHDCKSYHKRLTCCIAGRILLKGDNITLMQTT